MATSSPALQRCPNLLSIRVRRRGLCDERRQQFTPLPAPFDIHKDTHQWNKEPLVADRDSETELEPTCSTAVVWVSVSECELGPIASAVALAIAELPKTKALTSIDLSISTFSLMLTFLRKLTSSAVVISSLLLWC